MLQSQVNYWTLQENVRSHLAQEAIQWAQTHEAYRHNYATEKISADTLTESARHNMVSEGLSQQQTNINYDTLQEQHRANRVREKQNQTGLRQTNKTIRETRRHNKAMEKINATSNEIGFANVSLGYSQLGEQTRTHRANEQIATYESLTSRAAQEESKRHNLQAENQVRFENITDFSGNLPSQSQASTRGKEYEFEVGKYEEMKPYEKAQKATSSFSNITEGIRDLSQARKNNKESQRAGMDVLKSWMGAFSKLAP